jgi:hypothetical protein
MRRRVRGLVRLHLRRDPRSVEGICVGIVEGHYELVRSRFLNDSNPEHDDPPFDGTTFWREDEVLLVQRLS